MPIIIPFNFISVAVSPDKLLSKINHLVSYLGDNFLLISLITLSLLLGIKKIFGKYQGQVFFCLATGILGFYLLKESELFYTKTGEQIFLISVVALFSAFFVLYIHFLQNENKLELIRFEIIILLLFAFFGIILMLSSNQGILILLGLEIQAFTYYTLVKIMEKKARSAEAVFAKISFSTTLLYSITTKANFVEIAELAYQLNLNFSFKRVLITLNNVVICLAIKNKTSNLLKYFFRLFSLVVFSLLFIVSNNIIRYPVKHTNIMIKKSIFVRGVRGNAEKLIDESKKALTPFFETANVLSSSVPPNAPILHTGNRLPDSPRRPPNMPLQTYISHTHISTSAYCMHQGLEKLKWMPKIQYSFGDPGQNIPLSDLVSRGARIFRGVIDQTELLNEEAKQSLPAPIFDRLKQGATKKNPMLLAEALIPPIINPSLEGNKLVLTDEMEVLKYPDSTPGYLNLTPNLHSDYAICLTNGVSLEQQLIQRISMDLKMTVGDSYRGFNIVQCSNDYTLERVKKAYANLSRQIDKLTEDRSVGYADRNALHYLDQDLKKIMTGFSLNNDVNALVSKFNGLYLKHAPIACKYNLRVNLQCTLTIDNFNISQPERDLYESTFHNYYFGENTSQSRILNTISYSTNSTEAEHHLGLIHHIEEYDKYF